eukprot:TRINITY_DN4846_c0_g1_i4.p1 TRINITY_DN4846_c0_g1~~TRINITY_DN4846_c0_g1_i4.p1  ORF type:complete len:484 (-),score=89.07 TRINITY_DN4846_c0_g1_i4:572-2023(-)
MHPLQIPKSLIFSFSSWNNSFSFPLQNHTKKPILNTFFPPISTSIHNYNGFRISASINRSIPSKPSEFTREGDEEMARGQIKTVDVAALGNLCVDVVLTVPSLPPAALDERKAYMERLSASPPDKKNLEAGGNCNLAIAASRLGLRCVALGHVGNEIYGHFLLDVLQEEGIVMIKMDEDAEVANRSSCETLLCWVLVDPMQKHGFCSRADFNEEPAFSWMSKLSDQVHTAIKQSKILFCNGHLFDELSPGLITYALEYAKDVGTTIFFDPGPRGESLLHGTPEQQKAIKLFLKMSDVLLLTADEAEAVTGLANPILAGQDLIRKGVRMKWVIIKVGSKGSILITASTSSCAPSFKVNVVDTVGCGDSFAAAVALSFLHDVSPVATLALANAVGAATAMGYGAGRNVANLNKVLELLTVSNLNEDDKLWHELVDINSDATEVSLLSNTVIDGCNARLTMVPMQKVISELLPKLETLMDIRAVPT